MFTDRRSVLAGMALVVSGSSAMAQSSGSSATQSLKSPMPTGFAEVKNAGQYYALVLPRAELSLATSQLAVDKTTQKNALEFAGFELAEAITVNMVLKDIGTGASAAPGMDADMMAVLESMKKAAKGAAFDRNYIALQLENHIYLRDLADAYLQHTAGATDAGEKQGRHLASLMFGVFKEHTAICKRITRELKA